MTVVMDDTFARAGCTAWPEPARCTRCGGAGLMGPGSRWGLCRDCRSGMTLTEQEAWK